MTKFYVGYSGGKPRIYRNGSVNKILSDNGNIFPFGVNIQGDPHLKIYTIDSSGGTQNYLAQWEDNGGADNSEVLLLYIKTPTVEVSIYYTKQIIPRYSPAKTTKSIKTIVNGVTTVYNTSTVTNLNVNNGPISVGPLSLYITKRSDVSSYGTHIYFDWIIKSFKTILNVNKFGGGIPLACKKLISLNSTLISFFNTQAISTVSVSSTSNWQAGPSLVAGRNYSITATGSVAWNGPSNTSGPNGVVHPYNLLDNRFLHEALLGRLGSSGDIFLIGSNLTYSPASSDILYLTTNDTNRGDNSGSFSVSVRDATFSWTGSDGPTVDGFSDAGYDFGITLSDLEAAAADGIGTASWDKVSFDGSSFADLQTVVSNLGQTNRTTFPWDPLTYIEYDPLLSEPTNLSGIAYNNSTVVLSWTAAMNYGPSITDYTIEYSSDNGETWTTFPHTASSSTEITVTGLTNNTSYIFRVSAINSTGSGPVSLNSSSLIPNDSAPNPTPTQTPTPTPTPTPAASSLTIARDNGVSTFTGSGTAASPFVRATGMNDNDIDGVSHYSWTAGSTGTVTVSYYFNDDDGGDDAARIRKNGSVIHYTTSGQTITRTVSVVAGDIITIIGVMDGSQYFANISVYIS